MIRSRTLLVAAIAVLAIGVAGCATTGQPQEVLLSKKSPVELRVMESRAFDTTDKVGTLRAAIAALQDLGYTIVKVEPAAGTITANKLGFLVLTASVYPRGDKQLIVRANAIVAFANQRSQVDAPEFYQKLFFEPLAKAMFLKALEVEDAPDAKPPAAPPQHPDKKPQQHAELHIGA